MSRTLFTAAALLLGTAARAQDADPLEQAKSILDQVGSPRPAGLKVATLAPAGLTKADLVGTWKGTSTQGNNTIAINLAFEDDGTVSNTGSNGLSGRGTWTIDGDEVAIAWSTNGVKVHFKVEKGEIVKSGTTSGGQSFRFQLKKE